MTASSMLTQPLQQRCCLLAVLGAFTWASFKLVAALLGDSGKNKEISLPVDSNEFCVADGDVPAALARVPAAVLDAVKERLHTNSSNGIWAERVVEVSSELIARFIGRRGRNIFDLREKRLIQIKIVKIDSNTNYVFIFGRKPHVEEVARLINKQLLAFRLECHLRLGVPQEYISSIIGRQGSVINEIREDTSARIEIPKLRRLTKFSFDNRDGWRRDQSRHDKPPQSNGQDGLLLFPEIKSRDIKYNRTKSDFEVIDGVDTAYTDIGSLGAVEGGDEEAVTMPDKTEDDEELNLVFISGLPHHVALAQLKIIQIVGRSYRARKRRREALAGRSDSHDAQDNEENRERWENLSTKPGGLRFSALDDDDVEPVEYGAFSPLSTDAASVKGAVVDETMPLGDKIAASIQARISAAASLPSLWENDECPTVVSDRPPFPVRERFNIATARGEESEDECEDEYETVDVTDSAVETGENKLDSATDAVAVDLPTVSTETVEAAALQMSKSDDAEVFDVVGEILTKIDKADDAGKTIAETDFLKDGSGEGASNDQSREGELTGLVGEVDVYADETDSMGHSATAAYVFKSKDDLEAVAVNNGEEIPNFSKPIALEDPYDSIDDEAYSHMLLN